MLVRRLVEIGGRITVRKFGSGILWGAGPLSGLGNFQKYILARPRIFSCTGGSANHRTVTLANTSNSINGSGPSRFDATCSLSADSDFDSQPFDPPMLPIATSA